MVAVDSGLRRNDGLCVAVSVIVALMASPAMACGEDEGFLFACQTENPARSLYLCGRQQDSGEGLAWQGLRFLYRTEKGDEISYPADPAEGPKQLLFSHLFRNDLYEAYVRFQRDGLTYRLFFKDAPEGTEPDSGLEIIKDGAITEVIRCGERPAWYFDETRNLIACDMENPFGAQGCSNQVPKVP